MKRIILFVFAAAAILSCAKEPSPARKFTLKASMPSALTKTSLGPRSGDTYPVLWSAGDKIRVNGADSDALETGGGSTASFSFTSGIPTPYRILYGASGSRADAVVIPSAQTYVQGGIADGTVPMYAYSDDASFTMHHLSAVISLTLTGSAIIKDISVSSADGTPLAGSFAVNFSSGALKAESGVNTVQLRLPSGGVSLSGGKTFLFAVAHSFQSKGVLFEITSSDGSVMIVNALNGIVRLAAGRVYEIPSMTFTPNAEPVALISNYTELKNFASRVSAGELLLKARLSADITGDSSWTPMEGFKGDFDGAGHTISGLTKAFCNELTGCVRNLTLNSDISISSKNDIVGDESIFWAGILANRLYTYATVQNCVTEGSISYTQWGKELRVGGFAGYAPRGTVTGCVNKASVTATGDGSSLVQVGGLIGRNYSSVDAIYVENCTNEGTVCIGGTVKGLNVGGIVGLMDSKHTSTLKTDVNCGNIVIASETSITGEISMGGIAGKALARMDGCANYGTLQESATTTQAHNIGGIAGWIISDNMSSCISSGSILMDGSKAGVVRCGGLLGYATADDSINAITISGNTFNGAVTIDVPTHSTLFAEPITGLYNGVTFTETDNDTVQGVITVN